MRVRRAGEVPRVRTLPRTTPLVWVLEDDKLGHTTQSLGLAQALGWQYTRKALRFNAFNRLSNLILGAHRISVDRRRSSELVPPWPDLVIATGRRTAPVARWIRQQSQRRTRLVQLGRKAVGRADDFDLSVTCAHFALPPHPSRIETRAPLTVIDARRLREAGERWHDLFGSAPHPHVAMLVGGTSAIHRLDTATAERMGREVSDFVQRTGGALVTVTSPRTGTAAAAGLRTGLRGVGRFHEWRQGEPDNPYLGCLALADALIVTGDSESMLAEAVATGTPVYIYPLPERRKGLPTRLRTWVSRCANVRPARSRWSALCARLIELGLVRASRDVAVLHRSLIEGGYAYPFGMPLDDTPHTPLCEMELVAERVRALLDVSAQASA